jgi:hypothetical protein
MQAAQKSKSQSSNASHIRLCDAVTVDKSVSAASMLQRSTYRDEFCSAHSVMGKRSVHMSPEAMQAVSPVWGAWL